MKLLIWSRDYYTNHMLLLNCNNTNNNNINVFCPLTWMAVVEHMHRKFDYLFV